MTEDDSFLDEGDGEGDESSLEQRLDELECRLDALEENGGGDSGTGELAYAFGAALGMILSWSRNASILWCILHGLCSWVYVVYFAVTR